MGIGNSLPLRIISAIVLSFFLWTFCLFESAYAITNNDKLTGSQATNNKPTSEKPKTPKPEEKFQKTIESIENILADTGTDTHTKKGKLKDKKAEIVTLDLEIKKQFKETEDRIKDLPEVIKQRHRDFVKKYEDNLSTLKTNLDEIDKAKTEAEVKAKVEKARAHLEKVRPPKKHVPLDPNNLPNKVREIREYEEADRQPSNKITQLFDLLREEQSRVGTNRPVLVATNGTLIGLLGQAASGVIARQTPPTADDLAKTLEVRFTPEMITRAQDLGNNPVKIYEFVRNSVTYEPYYGSLKGSQQTFAEMAGNDVDQAGMLIALLRAANVPARYSCGVIELEMDRLMNWIGVKGPMTAATIMATNGIPGKMITEGGGVKYAQFSHCWVEAYVDMFPSMGSVHRQGSYWTPIDPSFKETVSSNSIDISKTVPFDETTYINTGDDMPPVLSYIYKLKDYYNTNYDYDFKKIFHVTVKKPEEFGIFMGTLPYKVITEQRYSEIPDAMRHKITLSLNTSNAYDTSTASVTKAYPEIAGKKVTVSYSPSTAQDQAVINNYGGLLKTPVYLIKVKAHMKLDDETILTGPEMTLGSSITFTAAIASPNSTIEIETSDLTRGINFAIGLPALTYPGTQLVGQIDRMRNLEGTLHDSINAMDSRAGELLHNIAIEYFGQLNNTTRSIEGIMHVQNTRMPSVAVISADAVYNEVFGMPVSPPIMKGLGIDAIRVACAPMPIDGDLAKRKEFIKHWGLNTSYLEHKILENLLSVESISAVKALQIAAKNGIPIHTVNKTNIDSIMPLLTISVTDKADIRNSVNVGKEVTVPQNNITLYDWTGVGYIARDSNTGVGAYMISGGLNGGGTLKVKNSAFAEEAKMAWFIAGRPDPKDDADTLTWWYLEDTILEMATTPVWQRYGYMVSIILVTTDKWFVEYAAKHPYTWIFHYSGHGSSDTGNDYLSPAPGEFVDSKGNAFADAKIVFLNSCNSAKERSFVTSFKIDCRHNGQPRPEALIGWTSSTIPPFLDGIALEFWLLMGKGKTASEAIESIRKDDINPFIDTNTLIYLPINCDSGVPTIIPWE